jgi:hypothetical protein
MSAETEPTGAVPTEPTPAPVEEQKPLAPTPPVKEKKKVTLPPEVQAPPRTPLAKLFAELPSIIKDVRRI